MNNFIEQYSNMVESLKRHQRAELLNDSNDNVIEELYTDPAEGDAILNTMLNDQTTLLIGRKGIGKSTIINRFQFEIRKKTDKISLYIDVRTLYSKSLDIGGSIDNLHGVFSDSELLQIAIYKNFIAGIINEIGAEVNKNIFKRSIIKQVVDALLSKNNLTEEMFIADLEEICKTSLDGAFVDISKYRTNQTSQKKSTETSDKCGISVSASTTSPSLSASTENSFTIEDSKGISYSTILKREYKIIDFANDLKILLQSIGINKVFICLDDCSELDKEALDLFIKTIIAPLHNNSDGFFRFKIALYPDRNTLPEIDRTKIDTCSLDYYDLYKAGGVDKVEEQAVLFVKRLLQQRIRYYFEGEDVASVESKIFDTKSLSMSDYYRLIFNICSCNPRNIGKLLFYALRRSISQRKPMTKAILKDAASEQYTNDIEPFITKDEFFQYKSYNELFNRAQLKKLILLITSKAKENKKKIGESSSNIFKTYTSSNAPSHFLFVKKGTNESLLATLELNFFITRISEQRDKGEMVNGSTINHDIVVYVINYGLCEKENIIFDDVNNRKYRIERLFDYNNLVSGWANSSMIVKCKKCGYEFDFSEWEIIQQFDCMCRECKATNACEIIKTYTSTKDEDVEPKRHIEGFKDEQLRIMHCLHIEPDLSETIIAEELDIAKETVRAYLRKDRKLRTDGYITKKADRSYCLTTKGNSLIK